MEDHDRTTKEAKTTTIEAVSQPLEGAEKEGNIVSSIIAKTWSRIVGVVNLPFKTAAEAMMKTLRRLGLNPMERAMIDESVVDKYVPVMRNAVFFTAIATPGVILNPGAYLAILTAIFAVTGIAWFTISLEKVKEKFMEFGIELTADMLEAFLTTLFLLAVSCGFSILSPQIANIIELSNQAGVDLAPLLEKVQSVGTSALGSVSANLASIYVVARIVSKTVKSVFKFDANDTLLTGTSDAARRFYEKALSKLHEAADILKEEHSLQAANLQIAIGLHSYYQYLREMKLEIPEGLEKNIEELVSDAGMSQKDIDLKVIPILKEILAQYEGFISTEKTDPTRSEYKFTTHALDALEKAYGKDKDPDQGRADSTIALALGTTAEFLEVFRDELASTVDTQP